LGEELHKKKTFCYGVGALVSHCEPDVVRINGKY